MSERNVYEEIPDRVLLRTEDVFQTEAQDEVESYSEKLLSIVADFKNSGAPDDFNAQSMVGKSKKGEVAIRLFARIDPETDTIEKAGFKTHGCLAMTGCASALCEMLEGMTLDEALAITSEDIREAVDGVPAGKINTIHFAPCAAKALVADFKIKNGTDIDDVIEEIGCDSSSISCIMAEHCSYRSARIEEKVRKQEEEERIAENNCKSKVFDLIRETSKSGELTTSDDWEKEGLIPAHLSKRKFEEAVKDEIGGEDDTVATEDESTIPHPGDSDISSNAPNKIENRKKSRFSNRGVGIPKRRKTQDADTTMPETIRALEDPSDKARSDEAQTDPNHIPTFDDLKLPEGYTLEEIDGEWVLVESAAAKKVKELDVDASGIRYLQGEQVTYFFDSKSMTDNYAHWAFLGAEDNPLLTFADCVREESRVYPRPMAISSFGNKPLNMDAATVEKTYESLAKIPDYEDIVRIEASNGDVYFYSEKYLDKIRAASIAEYDAVERFRNV